MREFTFVGENFKVSRSKERKLKGKVYLIFTIEKTEVFLSLEFFATWVMERERKQFAL
jgi:hypothetical protein